VINPRSALSRKNEYRQTLIRRGATLGANATILCGNEIGEFAFVGAGAVVTKPVPPYALVVGNPSRRVGWMSEFGQKLHFDSDGTAMCPESGQSYRLQHDRVIRLG
jgi:UDP-2-acetamido-3-amino-2,3-dideoxy-glucuronate N-acetyltransferase